MSIDAPLRCRPRLIQWTPIVGSQLRTGPKPAAAAFSGVSNVLVDFLTSAICARAFGEIEGVVDMDMPAMDVCCALVADSAMSEATRTKAEIRRRIWA